MDMGSLPDSKYIIKTDGYWFVEAHDVDPSKGYITVSAKGIVNGLSNQPNDGCDFGPDSYNPNYSGSGIPYTQTSGIQEAIDYCANNNYTEIRLTKGTFTTSKAITITTNGIMLIGAGGLSVTGLVSTPSYYDTQPITGTIINVTTAVNGVEVTSTNSILSGIVLRDFIVNYTNTSGGTGHGVYMNGPTSGYYSLMHFDVVNVSSLNVDSSHYPFFFGNFEYGRVANIYGKGEGTIFHIEENNSSVNFGNSIFTNWFGNQTSTTYTGNIVEFVAQTHDNGLNLIYIRRLQVNFMTNTPSNLLYAKGLALSDVYGMDMENGNNPSTTPYNYTIEGFSNVQALYFEISPYIPSSYTLNVNLTNVSRSRFNFIAEALTHNYTLSGVSDILIYATGTLGTVSGSGITIQDVKALGYVVSTTTPSVPASGTPQSNTNPYPVNVYLYGGTVTVIDYTPSGGSATQVGTVTPMTVRLNPGDSITLTYSAAPTWNWVAD